MSSFSISFILFVSEEKFRNEKETFDDLFKKLISEIESLFGLPYDADQTDDGHSDVTWKVVKGESWALHTKTKHKIEFVFSKSRKNFQMPLTNKMLTEKRKSEVILHYTGH